MGKPNFQFAIFKKLNPSIEVTTLPSFEQVTYLHLRQRYTRGSGLTVISDGSDFTTSIQLCGRILTKD
jgi:hypothetical protein